jgi:putative component of toxin-antitoxin plasmid stabilization module
LFCGWKRALNTNREHESLASRVDRLAFGLAGEVDTVRQGVSKLRSHGLSLGPAEYKLVLQRLREAKFVLKKAGAVVCATPKAPGTVDADLAEAPGAAGGAGDSSGAAGASSRSICRLPRH